MAYNIELNNQGYQQTVAYAPVSSAPPQASPLVQQYVPQVAYPQQTNYGGIATQQAPQQGSKAVCKS